MKEIQLGRGLVALVDDADFESLSAFKWVANPDGYAVRHVPHPKGSGYTKLPMHRAILGVEYGDTRKVDHIDGNRTNNQRSNLRLASHEENLRNRGAQQNNKSGYKGVNWHKASGKWVAQIKVSGKKIYLGGFSTPELAYAAYCEAAILHHGSFVNLGEAA